jgi:hypothetical protein
MRRAFEKNGLVKKLRCAKKSFAELEPYKMQAVEQRKPQTVDSSANKFVYAIATLKFCGTYPTGGGTHANRGQIAVHANGPGFRRIAERQQRLLHSRCRELR